MPLLTLADGCALQLYEDAEPATGAAQARVLLVHGLGEHAGRYGHVVAALQAEGLAVSRYDQRGHGRSAGPRGGLPHTDSLLQDLGQVIAHLRQRMPAGQPLLLLGHSMGGLVAGRFVAEGLAPRPAPWWQPVQGLVMSSPALDAGMNPLQRLLVATLAPLLPGITLSNGLDAAWVSRDPAVVQAYRADPLVHDRISPRLAQFFAQAGPATLAAAPRWCLPTLLLYAGADRCVAPRGSDAFAEAAPVAQLVHRRYDDLAHEIFNEPEREQVLLDLRAWLGLSLRRGALQTAPTGATAAAADATATRAG